VSLVLEGQQPAKSFTRVSAARLDLLTNSIAARWSWPRERRPSALQHAASDAAMPASTANASLCSRSRPYHHLPPSSVGISTPEERNVGGFYLQRAHRGANAAQQLSAHTRKDLDCRGRQVLTVQCEQQRASQAVCARSLSATMTQQCRAVSTSFVPPRVHSDWDVARPLHKIAL
jgi:hypothetical protein